MSVESASGPRRGEDIKQQDAELLQADVADLVLFLVGTVLSDVTLASVLYSAMMDWAAEAVEHAGHPQQDRAAGEAVPVYEFKRLVDLAYQDTQVRTSLDSAMRSVEEAARQLASVSPGNRAAWAEAWRVYGEAIDQLIGASTDVMRHDDAVRATPTQAAEGIRQWRREAFSYEIDDARQALNAPDPTIGRIGADTRNALDFLTSPDDDIRHVANVAGTAAWIELENQLARMEEERQQAVRPEDLRPAQGGVAPTPF
jgi:hypothetical protein